MNRAHWIRVPLAVGLVAAALAACGESESNDPGGKTTTGSGGDGGTGGPNASGGNGTGGQAAGGNGGTGGSMDGPKSTMCDGMLCEGLSLGIPGGPQTDACCPNDPEVDPCGVETEFLEAYDIDLMRDCQPLNSPGELDESCPESPPVTVAGALSFTFPGCCLPTGKCGFHMDSILNGAITLNLGCIDARELPNPDFEDPPDCDPGSLGDGGAGGAK